MRKSDVTRIKNNNYINRFAVIISIVLFAVIVKPVNVFSQTVPTSQSDSARYSLGAGLGLNDFHIKDEYLSPLPFRGILFSTKINFLAKLSKEKHAVELYFSSGSPEPDNQVFDVRQKIGLLSYSYLHEISKLDFIGSPIVLLAGAGLSSFVMNSDLITNSKSGQGSYIDQSWYWSHSVNIYVCGDYLLSENRSISIKLNMPFFRVVSRPANGHWMNSNNSRVINDSFLNAAKNGTGEFLWDNLVILCEVEYTQNLSDRFAFHGSYGFNFTSSNTPFSMGMYMNNLLIGIDWLL